MRIVFDLDGTLVDSAPQIHAITNQVLASECAETLEFSVVKSFIGNGLPVLLDRVCEVSGLEASAPQRQRMHDRFEEIYAADFSGAVLYPEIKSAIETLLNQGHAIGLCTNKPNDPTAATLAHFGLTDLFAAVIGGDTLPVKKPDPAPLLAAFAGLGDGPMVYVGDSEVDAACAAAAGVDFVLFTEGYLRVPMQDLKIRATFSDYRDLPGLLEQIAKGR